MKRNGYLIGAIIVLLFVFARVSAAGSLWVSSPNTSLKSEASASSDTIAELPVNTELTVVSTEGKWYQVSTTSGQKGWIYRGKVTETQPETSSGGGDSVGSLLGSVTGNSTSASAADTSRSMRGLSPEAQEYAKMSGTPKQCEQALNDVLTIKITGSEIENFLKNGQIGEYAK